MCLGFFKKTFTGHWLFHEWSQSAGSNHSHTQGVRLTEDCRIFFFWHLPCNDFEEKGQQTRTAKI